MKQCVVQGWNILKLTEPVWNSVWYRDKTSETYWNSMKQCVVQGRNILKLTETVWNLPKHYETAYDASLKQSETLWNLTNSDIYTAICEQQSEAQPTRKLANA